MNNQEIERLAKEYAELNPPSTQDEKLKENGINLNAKMVFESFLQWLVKTHCIVPKEKVIEKYSVCKMGYNECEAVDLGYAMGILEELFGTELFCGKEGGMSDAKDCKHIIPMNFKCIHIKTKMRYGKYIGCPRIFNTDIDCPDRCGRTACSRIRPTY